MAVPLQITDNYDALLTTTLRTYLPRLSDNVNKGVPLLAWLKEKGRIKTQNGGYEVIVPVLYGKSDAMKWYSGYDELNPTPQEGISAAKYGWHQFAGSVSISRKEERQNSGAAQLINLLDAKTYQCERSMQDEMEQCLCAGSSSSQGTGYTTAFADTDLQIPSLATFIPVGTTTPSAGTCGGIAGGTYSWWKAIWNQTTLILGTTMASTGIVYQMDKTYNDCSEGNDHPDLILCTQEMYQGYTMLGTAQERFVNTKMLDFGFENVLFRGCTMMFDKYLQGTLTNDECSLFFINSKHLWMVVDSETNFIATPFQRPTKQDARVSYILWMGTLVCDERRKLGVLQASS
jgi:hypothetical protein